MHPSEAGNPDNWPLLKDRISRPLVVGLVERALYKSDGLADNAWSIVGARLYATGVKVPSATLEEKVSVRARYLSSTRYRSLPGGAVFSARGTRGAYRAGARSYSCNILHRTFSWYAIEYH